MILFSTTACRFEESKMLLKTSEMSTFSKFAVILGGLKFFSLFELFSSIITIPYLPNLAITLKFL